MNDVLQLQHRLRIALQTENYPEAIECLQQAAALAHAEGDLSGAGRHIGNLALIYYRLKQPDEALTAFDQALALVRTVGDRILEDGLLGNMGNVLRESGQYDQAILYLNQALLIAQEIGDVRGRGIWLSNLGLVYDDLGQPATAVDYHREAVQVARQLQDQRGLALRLNKLGQSYRAAGQYPAALTQLAESLTIYGDLGETAEILETLLALAYSHQQCSQSIPQPAEAQSHSRRAYDYFSQVLVYLRQGPPDPLQAEVLANLGTEAGNLGNYEQAIRWYTAAGQLYNRLGLTEHLPHIQASLELARSLHKRP